MLKNKLLQTIPKSKHYIYISALLSWFSMLVNIFLMALLVYGIKNIINNSFDNILSLVVIGASGLVVKFILIKRSGYYSSLISGKVKSSLRVKIYQKLTKAGLGGKEKYGDAELTQLSMDGIEQLDLYFSVFLPQLIFGLIAPLTVFFIISFINFKVALTLIICVPFIPILIIGVNKLAKKMLKKYWGKYTDMGDTFLDYLQGLTTLKVFNADNKKHTHLNTQAENFRKSTMKVLTMQLNSITIMDLVAFGGAAIAIVIAISQMITGYLDVFYGLFVILLCAEFFLPLRALGSAFHIAMNGISAYNKIDNFLDLDSDRKGQQKVDGNDIEVEIDALTFSYIENKPVLKNVTLSLPKKGLTAIIGESGSGKSTIANLIMGYYDNYLGKINLNGKDVKNINTSSLADRIALVSGENHLFSGSVKQNLLLGCPKSSDEQLFDVLKKVNMYNFIISKKEKLDYEIKEKASNISGGERQRLLLARSLLMDSDMYIFDESTSNIDPESEEIIMKGIYDLSNKKNVLLITHKLANAQNASNIIVLKNGQLTEQGKHKNLMKERGVYYNLYTTQKNLENLTENRSTKDEKK